MGGNEAKGARPFSVVTSDRTRTNGHKGKNMKFHLNASKHVVTLRVL